MRRGGRRRSSWSASVLVVAALALGGCLNPAPVMTKPATGPVMSDPFADPFVMKLGDTYHAWATGYTNWPFYKIPYTSSTPGIHDWGVVHDAMPTTPAWVLPGPTRNFAAPSVLRRGPNDYLLYYTAQSKNLYAIVNGQAKGPVWCVGVARATQPAGPFVDSRNAPLVCQPELYGSIDPDIYRNPQNGRLHLYWKSEGWGVGDVARIWHQRLTADGLGLVSGTRHQLLAADGSWEGRVIENPSMARRDGRSWLFFSGNDWWTSRYGTGTALCDYPSGPCWRSWSTPMLGSSWNVAGPGGAIPVRGQSNLLAFAAWQPGLVGYWTGGERRLYFVNWYTWVGAPYVP